MVLFWHTSGTGDSIASETAPDPDGWNHPVRFPISPAHKISRYLSRQGWQEGSRTWNLRVYCNSVWALPQATEKLKETYREMFDGFAQRGLNEEAITFLQHYFLNLEPGSAEPIKARQYNALDKPLPEGSVRLVVVPLDGSPQVAAQGMQIEAEMKAQLKGLPIFPNQKDMLHITVFHTSKPTDGRPDAISPTGGTDLSLEQHQRPAPTAEYLKRELALMERLIRDSRPPTLTFERVVMAESGTLLMTWTDHTGNLELLRKRLRLTFPGATSSQAWIFHTSLFRILTPAKLSEQTREDIQAICDNWTMKLAGTVWTPDHLWYIVESEFSTIVGERHVIPLKKG